MGYDGERLQKDPQYAAWVAAREGARATRGGRPMVARPKAPPSRGLAALYRIHADVMAGLDRKALLERLADEIHKLKGPR